MTCSKAEDNMTFGQEFVLFHNSQGMNKKSYLMYSVCLQICTNTLHTTYGYTENLKKALGAWTVIRIADLFFMSSSLFILSFLLGQAKMGVWLYFLPHLAFAECLVYSDVVDSESAFIPLWIGLAHIIKVPHIYLLQPLSAEACIGIRSWIRPLGDASNV